MVKLFSFPQTETLQTRRSLHRAGHTVDRDRDGHRVSYVAMTKRVVTGYRPTGRLHLGHLLGNISSMRTLSEQHQCFFFIADWHALTTDYENPDQIAESTREVVLDWIAAGIDPFRTTIYKQSDIPEVAELSLYFSMVTPLGWLERNPTYKEQLRELAGRELATHGFVGYPVLQCADITIVKGNIVPVGEDQLPHLELTREIVRRFNRLYGDHFPEPQALLTEARRVLGPDGRKMSKSYSNVIWLDDPPERIHAVVRSAITDPNKVRKGDPGNPEVCNVYHWWNAFFPSEGPRVAATCRDGSLGCVEDKDDFAARLADELAGFRERRAELGAKPGMADEVLAAGRARVRPIAQETIEAVRDAMKLPHTVPPRA
jgi:tryptophanyl-tRNA synthetase